MVNDEAANRQLRSEDLILALRYDASLTKSWWRALLPFHRHRGSGFTSGLLDVNRTYLIATPPERRLAFLCAQFSDHSSFRTFTRTLVPHRQPGTRAAAKA